MVTITPEAVANVERFISIAGEEPMDWFVMISWRKGAADNRRTAHGDVSWERKPDEGWVAEIGGWSPGKVPRDEGAPLFGDVRVLIQNHPAPGPFPGGDIYVEGDELKIRAHAV